MRDRRAFLTDAVVAGLGSALSVLPGREPERDEPSHRSRTKTEPPADTNDRTLAARLTGVEPGTLAVTRADLGRTEAVYRHCRPETTATPFVRTVTDAVPTLSGDDIGVAAYEQLTTAENQPSLPLYVDSAVLPVPSGQAHTLRTAARDWEDTARESASASGLAAEEREHAGGVTRYLTTESPAGYRLQRLRQVGDRLLVLWLEGIAPANASSHPVAMAHDLERRSLARAASRQRDTDESDAGGGGSGTPEQGE